MDQDAAEMQRRKAKEELREFLTRQIEEKRRNPPSRYNHMYPQRDESWRS